MVQSGLTIKPKYEAYFISHVRALFAVIHLRKKNSQISGISDPDFMLFGFFESLSDMVHS